MALTSLINQRPMSSVLNVIEEQLNGGDVESARIVALTFQTVQKTIRNVCSATAVDNENGRGETDTVHTEEK